MCVLKLENVSYKYDNRKKYVLKDLNYKFEKGKFKHKKKIALDLLQKVGLNEDEANRRILKLSGGQQQRVAIARALSYNPNIILADEPTGNLDSQTQDEIMKIFHTLASEGKCVILVTHSTDVARESDEIYELNKISSEQIQLTN